MQSPPLPIESLDYTQIEACAMATAIKIASSDFRPRLILPVHRGGIIPAAILWSILNRKNLDLAGWEMMSILAKSYEGQNQKKKGQVSLDIPSYVKAQINKGGDVLVVDDIYDTGTTMEAIVKELAPLKARVRTAVLYTKKITGTHYYGHYLSDHKTWLEFPWEIADD